MDTMRIKQSVKQLSFKTLPATLAIQFKASLFSTIESGTRSSDRSSLQRFEQYTSPNNNTNFTNSFAKIDAGVDFPTELDMRPYMSDAVEG